VNRNLDHVVLDVVVQDAEQGVEIAAVECRDAGANEL
jgi:hypothetical protein